MPKVIEGFWNGNNDIIAEIFRRFIPNLCKRFCFDNDTAKDIIQQALYDVYKKRNPITGNLYSYLYRVCYNNSIDFAKKKSQTLPYKEADHDKKDDSEECHKKLKEAMLMQKAFDKIGEDCKKILNLKYGDNQPYSEVIRLFNEHREAKDHINENAARQRVHYCRDKAKSIFKQLKQEQYA